MSERGTFVTSFLYDWDTLSPILARLLPKVCRKDALIAFRWPDPEGTVQRDVPDRDKARWFSGLMHGGYAGEESFEMELFIEDEVIPALPEKHGSFSIVVMPESEEYARVFSIKDRVLTVRKLGSPEPR